MRRSSQPLGRGWLSLVRLKWLTIVGPAAFLAVVTYLLRGPAHEQLHAFPGYIYVLAVLTAVVSAFSLLVFRVIEALERRILQQNEELSQRNRELAALLAVGQAGSSSLDLADVLDAALAAVLRVTGADAAEVWLAGDAGELVLERQAGESLEAFRQRTRLAPGEGLPGLAAQGGTAVVVHDLPADPRFVRPKVQELGFQTFCALPLRHRDRPVGVLAVASRNRTALTSDAELRLLEGIGEQVAIAVENARLHERVLDAAVLEERERLARELHDGLAQVLGYVNAEALAIKKLLASGRRDEAEQEVTNLETAARRVFTDVREAILGLRASSRGLVPGLRKYLDDFASMTSAALDLRVGDGVEAVRLPPEVEIQLMRIAQEAISNVRKHASADHVTVALDVDDGVLTLQVADDGQGFDVARPVRTGWPHFGLQTMRERAEAIGGAFDIVSRPGEGTKVTVRVPLQRAWEVSRAGALSR